MNRRNTTLSLIISTSLYSCATFAHDYQKDESINAPYNWSGIYAGLNIGAVKHTLNMTDNQAASFNATIQQVLNPKITGGLQFGIRRQMDPFKTSGVYGLEFDAHFANARFIKNYGSPFALYQLHAENEIKYINFLQLIGGIAADKTLLFLAAGFSWTSLSGSVTNTDGIPFFTGFSLNRNALGSAIGAGVEYAYCDRLSMRLKVDVITPNAYTTNDDVSNYYQISNSIVLSTLGVNYKFG